METFDSQDIESTKHLAEARVRAQVDELVNKFVSEDILASLDAVVFSSCGGDLQTLIATSAVESLSQALGQNPVDILEAAIKNIKNSGQGGP